MLESFQKRGIKYILSNTIESKADSSYGKNDILYFIHCFQLKILPIRFRFDLHDLKIFHSIVYGFSCVKLPDYLTPFSGTRLRRSHLDSKCFVSSITPRSLTTSQTNFAAVSSNGFRNSFFYRAHLLWNKLPYDLRDIVCPGAFKMALLDHIWKENVTSVVNELRETAEHDVDT